MRIGLECMDNLLLCRYSCRFCHVHCRWEHQQCKQYSLNRVRDTAFPLKITNSAIPAPLRFHHQRPVNITTPECERNRSRLKPRRPENVPCSCMISSCLLAISGAQGTVGLSSLSRLQALILLIQPIPIPALIQFLNPPGTAGPCLKRATCTLPFPRCISWRSAEAQGAPHAWSGAITRRISLGRRSCWPPGHSPSSASRGLAR